MKTNIKHLKKLEFICQNCKASFVFALSSRKRTIKRCPNCDNLFYRYDSDPLSPLDDALRNLAELVGVEVNFICEKSKKSKG